MTRDFLSSLKGLDIEEAEKRVRLAGFKCLTVPEHVSTVAALAHFGTVLLYQQAGRVREAAPGDPLEIQD